MNKLIESFNNLNEQVRYSLLVGIIFLIILLDVVLLILPQMASIGVIDEQIKKLSDDRAQVLVDKEKVNKLKENLQKEQVHFKSLSIKLRPIQEVPAILSTISSIANEYGVKIDQLVPEKNQQEVLTSTIDNKYYALPIVIKAHCGYHMFGRFLSRLENEKFYFILKDFIIQNDGADPKAHLFSLTIKIILMDQALSPSNNL